MKYEDTPQFYTNTPVSMIDLEVLRENTINLYRTAVNSKPPTFQRNKDRRNQGPTGNNNSGITGNGWENWYHGAFRYQTGMEELHIEGKIKVPVQTGNDQIKVYILVNNTWELLETKSFSPNSETILDLSYDITVFDFNDGEIVKVQIDYDKAGAPAQYPPTITELYNVFVTPLALADEWPTLPDFSGNNALTATKLNQLSKCVDWLYRKLKLVPIYPTLATIHATLSFTRDSSTTVYWAYPDQSMYSGGVVSANKHDTVKVKGFSITKDAQERYILYFNDNAVDYWPSSSTHSNSHSAFEWELEYTLPENATGAIRVGNQLTSNTGGNDDPTTGKGRTRHYMYTVMENSATLPNEIGTSLDFEFNRSNQTYSNLITNLNKIKAAVQDTYDHIIGNPLLFDRAYVIRPIVYERVGDETLNKKWSVPMFETRKGDMLYVMGKNVSIGFGPIKIGDNNEWEFTFTEQILSSSENEVAHFINLDAIKGLFQGMQYFVYGDVVSYVSEYYL